MRISDGKARRMRVFEERRATLPLDSGAQRPCAHLRERWRAFNGRSVHFSVSVRQSTSWSPFARSAFYFEPCVSRAFSLTAHQVRRFLICFFLMSSEFIDLSLNSSWHIVWNWQVEYWLYKKKTTREQCVRGNKNLPICLSDNNLSICEHKCENFKTYPLVVESSNTINY